MRDSSDSVLEGVSAALSLTHQCYLSVFENAPVTIHSVDHQFKIKQVNRRWLEKLGYEKAEVLGRKALDFKSEESRQRTEDDVRPLLLRAGATRGIKYRFMRKDGVALDVVSDSDLCFHGCCFACVAMRDGSDDPSLWRQSSTFLETLSLLSAVRDRLLLTVSPEVDVVAAPLPPVGLLDSGASWGAGLENKALGALVEASRDTAANLRAMARIHADWRDMALE